MAAHREIARAIVEHEPASAESAARELVDVVHSEVLDPSQDAAG